MVGSIVGRRGTIYSSVECVVSQEMCEMIQMSPGQREVTTDCSRVPS